MKANSSTEKPKSRIKGWGCAVIVLTGLVFLASLSNPFSRPGRYGPKARLVTTQWSAKNLSTSAIVYASDHNGRFPHELSELVREGLLPKDILRQCLMSRFGEHQEPLAWIYLPDLNDKLPGDYPILLTPILVGTRSGMERVTDYFGLTAPKLPAKPTRIVATVNGEAKIMSEDEVQALLKKHQVTLPLSP